LSNALIKFTDGDLFAMLLPPLPHIPVPVALPVPHISMPHLFNTARLTPNDTVSANRKVSRTNIGRWTLTVAQDPFNGSVACTLTAPGMVVERGAVAFQLSPRADTSAAEYRLNDGAVMPARSHLATLAGLGVQVSSDDIVNPSRGRVYIPVKVVGMSSYVWVRPEKKSPARVFKVRDLDTAVYAARAAKCDPSFLGEEVVAR
jgi:hypothetical protein